MSRQRKNGLLRMLASRGAGMWAVATLGILTLLMIVNNFHLIWFHLRQSSYDGGRQLYRSMKQPFRERWDHSEYGKDYEERLISRSSSPEELQRWESTTPASAGSPITSFKEVSANGVLESPRRPWPPASQSDPSLPPGHPCQGFSLPPPPADKKRTGPRPCPVCYLPVENAINAMPPPGSSSSPVLKDLNYVEDTLGASGNAGSEFGGYPTLDDREKSYSIQETLVVHCGFVKGNQPGVGTGFDISTEDHYEMQQCRGVVVASAIFGNYDELQQPKNVSDQAMKTVCFFIFLDEVTGNSVLKDASLQTTRKVGLWRIIVVRNLPFSDARRNGKVPKLLIHRLFPNARFSLWVDGKLELVVDPYQILERFLWRSNDTFAISRHYARFDVFVEAEANKAAGKYSNASIDAQVEFYKKDGLTPYTNSKLPITSDVPEGCVIIREHTPITNLFGCLWFNEVDRFTSRDQLSFAIVRNKIMAQIPWRVNMFLDCERRNFVTQAYHKDLLEHRLAITNLSGNGAGGL